MIDLNCQLNQLNKTLFLTVPVRASEFQSDSAIDFVI
jgi:hypothetical protein